MHDSQMKTFTMVFGHFMGTESDENWRSVLAKCKRLRAFYLSSRKIIVDRR